jgi:hypothetical protein
MRKRLKGGAMPTLTVLRKRLWRGGLGDAQPCPYLDILMGVFGLIIRNIAITSVFGESLPPDGILNPKDCYDTTLSASGKRGGSAIRLNPDHWETFRRVLFQAANAVPVTRSFIVKTAPPENAGERLNRAARCGKVGLVFTAYNQETATAFVRVVGRKPEWRWHDRDRREPLQFIFPDLPSADAAEARWAKHRSYRKAAAGVIQ